MSSQLKQEFEFYLAHQNELVEQYNGRYIAIKDGKVLGAYGSEIAAVEETSKDHQIGTFLVQKVSPGDCAYTQTFHSRVAFA